jgi:uncharacterized membrane protein
LFSRNSRGERRVSLSLYKFLLTAHIIVSVGWLGAALAKLILGLVAVRSDVAQASQDLYVSMEALNIGFPPLAISTLVTGVLLSLGTRWGLLEHYWIVMKLLLTVGVITTAVQLDARFAEDVLASAAPPTLLLSLVAAHVLMLGMATVLSVYKPWGKTWFGRRKAAGDAVLPVSAWVTGVVRTLRDGYR